MWGHNVSSCIMMSIVSLNSKNIFNQNIGVIGELAAQSTARARPTHELPGHFVSWRVLTSGPAHILGGLSAIPPTGDHRYANNGSSLYLYV